MTPAPIEFRPRRGPDALFLMGALLFVAAGLWLALRRDSDARTRGVGLANVLFFGACAGVFVRFDLRSRPRLRLDSSGLEMRHPRPGASFQLAWPSVEGVTVRREGLAALVVVALRPPAEPPEGAVPDWARAKGALPLPPPTEAVLSPAELHADAETLRAEIDRFRHIYAPPPAPFAREGPPEPL